MSNNEACRLTCKEILIKEHPDEIDSQYIGGCKSCPSRYDYLHRYEELCNHNEYSNERCKKCWNQVATKYYENRKETNLEDSLSKFIDEVNKSKDREVMIFITKDSTTVTSRPIRESPETFLFVDDIADKLLAIAKEDNLTARERFIEILESLVKDVKLNPDLKIVSNIKPVSFYIKGE